MKTTQKPVWSFLGLLVCSLAATMLLGGPATCYVTDIIVCHKSKSCNIDVCNVNNCTLGPHFMGTTDQGLRNIVVQVTPPHAGSMTDKYQLPRCTYVCQAVCGVCGQQIQKTKIGDVQMQASNQYCP